MSLAAGQKLSHYEIVEPIGKGGMGEVFRARDGKLGRDVAIKVLPDEFAQDKERLGRFQREAKVLASLNHPNIAAIYGLERSKATHYLVLELVDGETLAERIARGPIPLDEALEIAGMIAEALEEAHEQGIVHRDLKPANIKLTPDDKVKVLDFGLAKAYTGDSNEGQASDLSVSPTMTRATAVGMILGTAGYMSPEQARGKPVDNRSDIWAFGVVLFEMLTGRTLFEGETVSDVLAAVLRAEIDWARLPAETPASVRRLLRRCLARDPLERLQHIGDARLEIDEASKEPKPEAIAAPSRPFPWMATASLGVLAAAAGGLVTWLVMRPDVEPVRRFEIELESDPTGIHLSSSPGMALSPDGRNLVYRVEMEDGSRLYVRPLDRLAATPIAGTEDGTQPFFSPDGKWVAFFANDALKKVRIAGGPAVTLCDVDDPAGGSWSLRDTIVFAQRVGLYRVSAAGGAPERVPASERLPQDGFSWPSGFPGERAVLVTTTTGNITGMDPQVSIVPLSDSEPRVLIENAAGARYVSTGHVVFFREGTLFAARFDPDRLELLGEAFPVVENVQRGNLLEHRGAEFAVAGDGTLAYLPRGMDAGARERRLVWVDREGRETEVPVEPRPYLAPRFSPNGRRVVVAVVEPNRGRRELWTLELNRNALTRLTFSEVISTDPVWSPDGKTIAFASSQAGGFNIFTQTSSGIADPVQWTSFGEGAAFPRAWSANGESLLFDWLNPGHDIGTLAFDEEKSVNIQETPFDELQPAVSPDGRFLAYTSNESGEREIYVRGFPEADRKWQISTNGGTEAVWSPSGEAIFYRENAKMMSVAVTTEPEFRPEAPVVLFERRYALDPFSQDARNYDIAPDGSRFLMVKEEDSDSSRKIHIVLNWFQELERN